MVIIYKKTNHLKSHINLFSCKFPRLTHRELLPGTKFVYTVNVLLTVAGSKSLWFTSALPEMLHIIYLPLLNFSMSFNMNLYNSHGKEDLMSHM
jgi:hypothetical protein